MTIETRTVTVAANGRRVVPQDVRRRLGLEGGGRLLLRVEDGRIVLETVATAVARAQALARRSGDPSRSLADELVAERRAEVDGA